MWKIHEIISTVNYTNIELCNIIFICNCTNTHYRGDRPPRTNSFANDYTVSCKRSCEI